MLESELESSLKRSLQIKEDKMAALEARLQESSSLNQQLRQELKTVSRVIRFPFFGGLFVPHVGGEKLPPKDYIVFLRHRLI